jgi:hypothetical protein
MEFVFLNVFSYFFRSQMGCVVLDDFLYVLGGTNRHNEVLQVPTPIEIKDSEKVMQNVVS